MQSQCKGIIAYTIQYTQHSREHYEIRGIVKMKFLINTELAHVIHCNRICGGVIIRVPTILSVLSEFIFVMIIVIFSSSLYSPDFSITWFSVCVCVDMVYR